MQRDTDLADLPLEPTLMKVAYLAKEFPFGETEAFILPEVESHIAAGWSVLLVPLTRGKMIHGHHLLAHTLSAPLISPAIVAAAAAAWAKHPIRTARLFAQMARAPSLTLAIRNAVIFPKALWLGHELQRLRVDHIHIHWIAAPATLGVVAANVAGVPYSITAHRYDIAQNNLIRWKAANAVFLRAIDKPGAEELRSALTANSRPPVVLHMGVSIPESRIPQRKGFLLPLRLVIAARLVAKKGHTDLLDAMRLADDNGITTTLDVFGEGPLRDQLTKQATHLGLTDRVNWRGVMSHKELLKTLQSGIYDACVLPSVTTDDGDREGIPVFLIESMGMGLPVITTANGGILELAGEGRAIIVPERDPIALANALSKLANDENERERLGLVGREKVKQSFEVSSCMGRLRSMIMYKASNFRSHTDA